MEPVTCFVCSTPTVFYHRNPFKILSKHTKTRICTFLDAFLDQNPTKRADWSSRCVCMECLGKIDDYDLACQTAERIESELRELLQCDKIVSIKVDGVKIEESSDITAEDGNVSDSAEYKLAELQIDQVLMDGSDDFGDPYSDEEENEDSEVVQQNEEELTANGSNTFQCRRCRLNFVR